MEKCEMKTLKVIKMHCIGIGAFVAICDQWVRRFGNKQLNIFRAHAQVREI